ncbi:MAG: hypothetical protein HY064_07035 [Bacteroidetes bacterium]|nr:hypothetical protein [Bacteroidota bacterium]
MKKGILIFSAFVFFSFSSSKKSKLNNYQPQKKFSVQELKDDFTALRKRLELKNPGLYIYTPKDRLDKIFDSLASGISKPMTDLEFYRYIAPLTSFIKDGHTFEFPGMSCEKYYTSHSLLFPFKVHCTSDRIFTVMCGTRDTSVRDGSEIMSINGIPAKEIVRKIKLCLPRDGNNTTLPSWLIDHFFRNMFCFVFGPSENFVTEFRYDDRIIHNIIIEASCTDSISKIEKERYPARYASLVPATGISLDTVPGLRTAILTIRSFDKKELHKKYHQYFKTEIRKYFAEMQEENIRHLIIDLRGNGGGNPDYARFLAAHLVSEKFVYIEKCVHVSRFHYNDPGKRLHSRWYPYCGIGKFSPEKNNFTGDIFILADGGSFSATGEFCAFMKENNRATFVGEEAGGNTVFSGGYIFKNRFILPHTKLQVHCSTFSSVIKDNVVNDGHGVLPDHIIVPTTEDLIMNRDVSEEYAEELIRNKMK